MAEKIKSRKIVDDDLENDDEGQKKGKQLYRLLPNSGIHVDADGEVYKAGDEVESSLPLDKLFENKFEPADRPRTVKGKKKYAKEGDNQTSPASRSPTEDSTQTTDDPVRGQRDTPGIRKARKVKRAEEEKAEEEVEKRVKKSEEEAERTAEKQFRKGKKVEDEDEDEEEPDEDDESAEEEESTEDEESVDFGEDVTEGIEGASDGGYTVFKGDDGYNVFSNDDLDTPLTDEPLGSKKKVGTFIQGQLKRSRRSR